jgi:hypothetical protein
MRGVWTEIYKRKGGAGRGGAFVHSARREVVEVLARLRGLRPPEDNDQFQDTAAELLFVLTAANSLWDKTQQAGPRTRIEVGETTRATLLRGLAERHERDAEVYERLGAPTSATLMRTLATSDRQLALGDPPDQMDGWLVARRSNRLGSDWDRGFVIEAAQNCVDLFGTMMLGTVATLANTMLDRGDITKGMVQGVVRHLR